MTADAQAIVHATAPAKMAPRLMERAFELARSGEYEGLTAIKRALAREGFENVQSHISGPSLSKQLADLCTKSKS